MIDLDDSLSDPSEFDHYQAWAQYHAAPPRHPAAASLPDPDFRFLPPQRPCGIVGPVLGSACGDCRRCPERLTADRADQNAVCEVRHGR